MHSDERMTNNISKKNLHTSMFCCKGFIKTKSAENPFSIILSIFPISSSDGIFGLLNPSIGTEINYRQFFIFSREKFSDTNTKGAPIEIQQKPKRKYKKDFLELITFPPCL